MTSSQPHPAHQTVQLEDTLTDPHYWLRDNNWRQVLEHPHLLRPDIRAHLETENSKFKSVTHGFSDLTSAIAAEMTARIIPDHASAPVKAGDFEYWHEFKPGGNYPIHMQRQISRDMSRVLFDGNVESIGHDFFDLSAITPSPDHTKFAYALDRDGSEYFNIRFRDIATGDELFETLPHTKGEVVWASDSAGIYYTECDARHVSKRVKFHRLGTDAAHDLVIYDEPESSFDVTLKQSASDAYLFIQSQESDTSEVRFLKCNDRPGTPPTLIAARVKGHEYGAEHHEHHFYIRTNADDAVNFKIVRTPVDKPTSENWVDVTPHRADVTITHIIPFQHFMVRQEFHNALPRIAVSDYNGSEHVLKFDGEAFDINIPHGHEFGSDIVRINYQNPATPSTIYDFSLNTGTALLRTNLISPDHNPDDYIVQRTFIDTRDGKKAPVTLLRHASTKNDGSSPLYLYGYGSYGGALEADFMSNSISLVDRGVVYAIAHVRGGGEMGREWYLNGRREHKQNSFNDFIDTARALVGMGFGKSGEIVIEGESAGGLLIGASLNQEPELFGGAIANVPFVDVMNSMCDPSLPWVTEERTEWGDPAAENAYRYMRNYSPYDNIDRTKKYPPILAIGGLMDSRVMYWEPAKWVARLNNDAMGGPFYLKTHMHSGHLGSAARFDSIHERAEEMAFALNIFKNFGYDITLRNTRSKQASPTPTP